MGSATWSHTYTYVHTYTVTTSSQHRRHCTNIAAPVVMGKPTQGRGLVHMLRDLSKRMFQYSSMSDGGHGRMASKTSSTGGQILLLTSYNQTDTSQLCDVKDCIHSKTGLIKTHAASLIHFTSIKQLNEDETYSHTQVPE